MTYLHTADSKPQTPKVKREEGLSSCQPAARDAAQHSAPTREIQAPPPGLVL